MQASPVWARSPQIDSYEQQQIFWNTTWAIFAFEYLWNIELYEVKQSNIWIWNTSISPPIW